MTSCGSTLLIDRPCRLGGLLWTLGGLEEGSGRRVQLDLACGLFRFGSSGCLGVASACRQVFFFDRGTIKSFRGWCEEVLDFPTTLETVLNFLEVSRY